MIKYFCDRCGKELTKERRIGYIAVNTKDKADGDLQEDNEFENNHYCGKCTEDIRRFIKSAPVAATIQEHDEKSQDDNKNEQFDNENAQNDAENVQNETENDKNSLNSEKTVKKRKIDIGKIVALRKAGWKVKDIADEMNLTNVQVSQALYQYKRKCEQGVEE